MRQALELALEALEDRTSLMKWQIARDAVKEALAQPEHEWVRGECVKCGQSMEQPEQEPVAWVGEISEEAELMLEKPKFQAVPLYTTPPQRPWVGLADEELPPLVGDNGKYMELQQVRRFYKYIEAKLKEKNT